MEDFIARLDSLLSGPDPSAAEGFMLDTLRSLESAGSPDTNGMITVLSELGNYMRGVSRYGESLEYYSRAVELLEQSGSVSALATARMNMAGTYRFMGRLPEAAELFLSVKELLESTGQRTGPLYAATLNNLALNYCDMGKMKEALETSRQSLRVVRSSDADSFSLAMAIANLAALQIRAGELEEASENLDEALALFEISAPDDPHRAGALSSKASLLVSSGKLDQALECIALARSITLRVYGENADTALLDKNAASILKAMGDLSQAEKYINECLDICLRVYGKDNDRTRDAFELLEQIKNERS